MQSIVTDGAAWSVGLSH